MKKEIILYDPAHARWIIDEKIRKHDMWLKEIPGAEKMPAMYAEHPSYTLMIDDQIVMCCGMILLDEFVGDAWTLMADDFLKYPLTVFKTCRALLEKIALEHNLKRVQAVVDHEVPNGFRFVEHLGLKKERTFSMFGMTIKD